jgi:hypothetical protein
MMPCPSDFALDDAELHGGSAAHVTHLRSCARCAARLGERRALGAEFREREAERVWEAIRRRPPRRARRALLVAAPLAAAAAGLLLVVRPRPYVGAKGTLAVEIICRRGERIFALGAGDGVSAGDELRFRVRGVPERMRFIAIGSVDGTGQYAPFFPDDLAGESLPTPGGDGLMPGAVTLDGAPGPERILVVTSAFALPMAAIADAARAQAGGRVPDAIAGQPVHGVWIALPKGTR